MSYQSLYRRYRPRRFSDVRGQEHVITALKSAVNNNSVGHAYLFSGPRGTGKTTTARILAKALNCTNLHDGEPCGECESCQGMDSGRSYDLFELDAASNNGVDAMRDLIAKAAVGSPGRTKVYILDEVHMLSTAASNALLKTLEEPPDHVKFVLATTDPQKVLPTIKSRTQHFAFELLTAEQLEEYVRWILNDAGLELSDEAIDHVVRSGRGSARDTISVLEQVVASGGVVHQVGSVDDLVDALAANDVGAALAAVDAAVSSGRDPKVLAESLVASLRDVFLASMGSVGGHIPPSDLAKLERWRADLKPSRTARALELVGQAILDMRQASEPRIPFEVALVRVANASLDSSFAALLERVERLEAALAGGAPLNISATGGTAAPASVSVTDQTAIRQDRAPVAANELPEDDGVVGVSDGPDSRSGAATARQHLAGLKRGSAPVDDAAPPKVAATPPPPRIRKDRPVAASGSDPAAVSESAPPSPSAPPPRIQPTSAGDQGETRSAPPRPAAEPTQESEAPPKRVAADDPLEATAAVASTTAPASMHVADAYNEAINNRLKGVAKALFNAARLVSATDEVATVAFSNGPTLERAKGHVPMVAAALLDITGKAVEVVLVTDDDPKASGPNGSGRGHQGSGGRSSAGAQPSRGPGVRGTPRAAADMDFDDDDPFAGSPIPDISTPLRAIAGEGGADEGPTFGGDAADDVPVFDRPSLRVVRDGDRAPAPSRQTGVSTGSSARGGTTDRPTDGDADLEFEDADEPQSVVERILAAFPGSEPIFTTGG